jgi:hypothetical protein
MTLTASVPRCPLSKNAVHLEHFVVVVRRHDDLRLGGAGVIDKYSVSVETSEG